MIAKRVEAPFSQVCVLIEQRLLDEQTFFRLYYAVVLRSWRVLEDDIIFESARSGVSISEPFKKLATWAEEYRIENKLPEIEIYGIPKF